MIYNHLGIFGVQHVLKDCSKHIGFATVGTFMKPFPWGAPPTCTQT